MVALFGTVSEGLAGVTNSVHSYDVEKRRWTRYARMLRARIYASCFIEGGNSAQFRVLLLVRSFLVDSFVGSVCMCGFWP